MSVTTTFALTALAISEPPGANMFLETTKSIAVFISVSVISSLGSSIDKETYLSSVVLKVRTNLLLRLLSIIYSS